jgi:hypothetical protein
MFAELFFKLIFILNLWVVEPSVNGNADFIAAELFQASIEVASYESNGLVSL